MSSRLAQRILLLGWSGADWQVIQPLLDAGQMPHLEQLVNDGAMGNLATLRPIVSPMLWTSIATGKRSDEHGVHAHLELRPDRAGTRPVSSTSLRARPLWQILPRHGLRSAVVGWDATHPASAAGGLVVSDHFRYAQGSSAATWPMPPESVAPTSLREVMRDLRVHPTDLTAEQVAGLVPTAPASEWTTNGRLAVLGLLLAQVSTIHSAGTWLAEHETWDLLSVQYSALDTVCREYGGYRTAATDGADAEDVERYRDVVDRVYQFYDALLGRYMRLVGPETTIMIVSEHGLSRRWQVGTSATTTNEATLYAQRPYGILVARGPGIARDKLVFGSTLLDVAPTVLTMLGLPIGRDMEGRVLTHMFVEPVEPSYVDSHGAPAAGANQEDDDDPEEVEAAIRHLESLGYARAPATEADRTMEEARIAQAFNLAEAHFAREHWREASDLFGSVLASRPTHSMAQFRLVQCRLRLGDVEGGRALAGDFLSHDIDSPWAHLALGLIDAFEERWDEALARFDRAHDNAPNLPDIHYRTGGVRLRQKQWGEAETAFRRSLEAEGESAHAYHGLGLALHAQRRYGEAAETLMRSIGLVYHQPVVHFHLGLALYGAGYVEAAVESLETAVEFQPDLGEAHGILARVLRSKGDLVRAARHEAAGAALRAQH